MFSELIDFLQSLSLGFAITDALGGVIIVLSWVVFLHDGSVFEIWFSLTLDVFLLSFVIGKLMALIRWIIDVIPFI